MSRRLPRERRKLSRSAVCSRLSRANRPTENSPSSVVPQDEQRSRVTASSPEQTGQVEITSCAMRSSLWRDARIVVLGHHNVKASFHFVKWTSHVGVGEGQ